MTSKAQAQLLESVGQNLVLEGVTAIGTVQGFTPRRLGWAARGVRPHPTAC